MSEEKGYIKGLLLGILAGGVTGGLIALLYAPKSGTDLRRDIANKKNELIGDAEEYMERAKYKTSRLFNDEKKLAGEFVEDVKRKTGEISQSAGNLYNSGKETVSKIKGAFKSGVDAYNDERERG